MTEKDLSYRLTADSRGFERGFKSAEASARAFERELARLEAQEAKVEAAMSELGVGMAAVGAAIAAGLVMAARAAIQWESAWTGVAKVVDGTPEQLAALEDELRGLTRVLPQTHEEIAGVAAAAAQLGIAREDLVDFTRVMVDLGVSTNLASEEAAFALSRLMNIMQTAPDDVGRLGAAVVQLGNTSATTEADIVEMALRIAGAGHTVRMSEADVLGWAAALSSAGVQAEAGGSAISRAFIGIDQAVRQGGDKLTTFAQVSGMTVDEFRRAWEMDAAQATARFVEGLGRMQAAGGDVFSTLQSLGMSEILLRDALLRLAGAGDLVSRSLDNANRGWEEQTALLDEAERRYQTTESRMLIARNAINDFAIDVGNVLLPVVGRSADLIGDLAGVLADLPGPIKAVVAVLAVVVAGLLLVGGTALFVVPQIAAYRAAVETLINSQGRLAASTLAASNAMGRVGSFLAGPWGLAIGAAIVALTAFGVAQAEARGRARELADTLDEQSGAVTRDTAVWVANQLAQEGVLEAAEKLGISAADLTQAILGNADAYDRVNQKLLEYNTAVGAGAASGQTRNAREVREALDGLGGDVGRARDLYEQLTAAQEGNTKTVAELDPATRALADGLGVTAGEAEQLAAGIDDLSKELSTLYDNLFGVEEAEDAAIQAMKRMVEAAKENKGALDGNSEAALTNRDNVRAVINAHLGQIQAMAEAGASSEELTAKAEQLRAQFIKQATQAGLNKDAIEEYAGAYDAVPGAVSTTIKTPGAGAALSAVQRYVQWLHSIPPEVRTRLITEQQRARGGNREFNATGGLVGRTVRGYAGGGGLVGGPFGYDAVPLWGTAGEFMSTVAATQLNRAALEAANAGARLAVVGSAAHRADAAGVPTLAGRSMTPAGMAQAIRGALVGLTVQIDGRAAGYITGRDTDLLSRAGGMG
nr:phage tail tape measure protein [Micromonospora sp. DSM 115978]